MMMMMMMMMGSFSVFTEISVVFAATLTYSLMVLCQVVSHVTAAKSAASVSSAMRPVIVSARSSRTALTATVALLTTGAFQRNRAKVVALRVHLTIYFLYT